MVTKELISIVVPVYNAEKYLNDCIESIARQTYSNIEILLVNDGSIDGSDEICRKWANKDKRVKVICQENAGVSKARNTGIENVNGDLLVMVDSDDYVSPDMIEILHSGYVNNNAEVVVCDFEQGENRQHTFLKGPLKFKQTNFETIMNKVYEDGHNALRYIAPWGKLYKKALFKDIQYPEGKIFEDIYITHQVLYKAAKIIEIDQKLLYYYCHEDSIMHKPFHIGKLDYLDALKERMAFFKLHQLSKLEKNAYEDYLHSLIWEYSRVRDILHDESEKKEIISRFRDIYIKGYSSEKYPQDTSLFLKMFYINPELIIMHWKIKTKLEKLKKKNNETPC